METDEEISRIASLFGRRGGLKGGPARAAALSPERRKEIARTAGLARQAQRKIKPNQPFTPEQRAERALRFAERRAEKKRLREIEKIERKRLRREETQRKAIEKRHAKAKAKADAKLVQKEIASRPRIVLNIPMPEKK